MLDKLVLLQDNSQCLECRYNLPIICNILFKNIYKPSENLLTINICINIMNESLLAETLVGFSEITNRDG